MLSGAPRLFSTDGFMPHGMCYLWRPGVLGLHLVSDLLIALAYLSIPFTLLYFVHKRRDLKFNWMFVCFAVFIIACGATHLMEILVIWHPVYWLSGAIKAVTALASMPTAILLVRLVPTALAIPNPAALRDAYADLEAEVAVRSRAEEELRIANDQLRGEAARGRLAAIVESSDDAIISKTLDGIVTSWNRGAEVIFGYTQAQMLGHPLSMLIPPERACEENDILRRVSRGERVDSFETVRIRKDGVRIDVSATISPIIDGDGNIVGASKIARDITERKCAEEALIEQAKILDLAQVIVRDPNGRILRWSRGAQKLYGFTADEALGRISHELLHTQFHDPLEKIEAQLDRTGIWEGELKHITREGTRIDVASTWVLHRDAQGLPKHVLESSTDVSERKGAERKLAAQLARLHLLNAITRALGERQDLPSIFQVVTGTLEEQLPVDFACLTLFQPPDALVVAGMGVKSHRLAAALGMARHTRIQIEQNGLSRCACGQLAYEPDVTTVQLPFPQRLAAVGLRAMVSVPLLVENKIFGALIVARREPRSFSSGDCEFLGQLSEHVSLAAHQTQLYGALQVAYQDLRQTQQAVMRQENLRVLGQMASGIAHDINNALSPAALYVESLLERNSIHDPEARGHLMIIQRAIDGVAQTVARMKEFYSQRDPERVLAAVRMNPVVEQVVDLTRARWNAMAQKSGLVIQVETDLAPDLPDIIGDEGEIRDAITNLVLNAVDAMPTGGRLSLRSRTVNPGRVQIEVTDTGVGMDDSTRSRCLELFFTTKGVRGTGLGLAMVYGTVERHGAELQIDSKPGAGTSIRLTFPAASIVPCAGSVISPQSRPSSPQRILIIDDDPIILTSLRTILEQDGHTIEAADGGQRGIDAFCAAVARNEPFSAVITDLGMPHVDGRTVATAVKSVRSQTPIILLTGWGHRLLAENDAPPNVDRVLGKPPKLTALRAMLEELTGGLRT